MARAEADKVRPLRLLGGAGLAFLLGAAWTLALYDGPGLYYHLLGFGFDPPYGSVLLAPRVGFGVVSALLVAAFASGFRWPVVTGGLLLCVLLTGIHFSFGKDLEGLPLTPGGVLGGVIQGTPHVLTFGLIHAAFAYALVAGGRALLRRRLGS